MACWSLVEKLALQQRIHELGNLYSFLLSLYKL
jgi:hypothetical protein